MNLACNSGVPVDFFTFSKKQGIVKDMEDGNWDLTVGLAQRYDTVNRNLSTRDHCWNFASTI